MSIMKLYTGHPHDAPREDDGLPASKALLESHLLAQEERLRGLPPEAPERHRLRLEMARTRLRMEEREAAWGLAREAFDQMIEGQDWEAAVEAAEVLFLSEQEASLAALGQGVWLAVTFPIAPERSIEMLRYIVDETPDDADGAAVAAATACYLAELRASDGRQRENLTFYAGQMLSNVARRHSAVDSQEDFEAWLRRLELDQPAKFLVRLRNVVDVLVQDEWWLDREAIQSRLPVN